MTPLERAVLPRPIEVFADDGLHVATIRLDGKAAVHDIEGYWRFVAEGRVYADMIDAALEEK